MRNQKNNESGVTLIALVITIIIILILTGMAIRFAVGEDEGIITKTNGAVEEQTKAEIKDEIGSAWSSATIDYLQNKQPFAEESAMTNYLCDKTKINGYLHNGEITGNITWDTTNKYYSFTYDPSDDDIEGTFSVRVTADGEVIYCEFVEE